MDTLKVSQPDPYQEPWRYTRFDRNTGLSGGVLGLYEDRDGAMWFATNNGVQRYDGYRWTTYTTADGLAHNTVDCVLQDRDGEMWFGTAGGINRFGPAAAGESRWTNYRSELAAAGLYGRVTELVQDRGGVIWARFEPSPEDASRSQGQLGRFDGSAWSLVSGPVGKARVRDLLPASDGTVWIATGSVESNRLRTEMGGLEFGKGVFRFDPTPAPGQDAWTQFTRRDGLGGDDVYSLIESSDGAIWAACLEGGISRFEGERWRSFAEEDGLPAEEYRLLWQTLDGDIWARATGSSTPVRFDGKWGSYRLNPLRFSLSSRGRVEVAQAFVTRSGVSWFWRARLEVISRFDPDQTRWRLHPDLPRNLSAGSVSSTSTLTAGNEVWMGGPGGVVHFDGDHWIRYTARDGLIDGEVRTVLKDRQNRIWAAGKHAGKSGAARFDGKTWRLFTEADGLVGTQIYTGIAAENGDLWFGTKEESVGHGVMRYDDAAWTTYTTEDGLSNNIIYALAQTKDGSIWAGTRSGLGRFSGGTWTSFLPGEDTALHHEKMRTVCADGDAIWVGHGEYGGGAIKFDPAVGQGRAAWTQYTTVDGLTNNLVFKIHLAADRSLWVGTGNGLNRFDGETWRGYAGPIEGLGNLVSR